MNTSLTIILQVDELSGEFKNMINECLKIKPNNFIVNSTNSQVIDYYITHYRKHGLTCYNFEHKIENKIDLHRIVKETSNNKLYKTDHYFILNTVNPVIDINFLRIIYDDYIKSNAKYGMLTNSISYRNLILPNEMNNYSQSETIEMIYDNLLFYNTLIENESYHYIKLPYLIKDFYEPYIKLVNKTVLITGALGGIGLAIAKKYKKEGWSVIGIDLKKKENLTSNQKEIFNHYYDLDLSHRRYSRIEHKYNRILKKMRRLDLLVHAAGLQISTSIETSRSFEWDKIMSVNLKSIYFLSQQSLPIMKKTIGNIVIIGSIHSIASSDNISMYAISKAAITGLVRNFAIECSKYGIRVNGIAPGAIDTKMLRDGITRRGENINEAMINLKERHLMRRIGHPNEIAELVNYLGDSEKSHFLIGQTIIIDGGASLVLSTEVNPIRIID